jgi:hypothetical protein
MARPIGAKSTLNGKSVLWAGDNYGWQSPGSYKNLEQQGKFKVGTQLLDRLGSYLGPVVKNVQDFQAQVKAATPWLDPLDRAVNKSMHREDKLPSSVVARGGAVAAQRVGSALNLDPRLGFAGGLLIGGVHKEGPKKGTYKWKATPDLREYTDTIENAIENAHQHFKKHNSLDGHNNLIDLPNGRQLRISNKSGVNFERRVGLSPVAVAPKAGKVATPSTPKPNVSTPVTKAIDAAKSIATETYGIDGINYDRLLSEVPVTSILDPRYVARVEQLHSTFKGKNKELKDLMIDRPDRTINSLIGQPTPDLWSILSKYSVNDLSDVNKAAEAIKKLYQELDKRPKQESWGVRFIEGHHPVQVESVAAASEHLSSMYDRLRFTEKLGKYYTYSGTSSRDMFPISKTGHTGAMNPNGIQMSAHVGMTDPDLANPNLTRRTGSNWALEDFTDITDPDKLVDVFWQRSGEPQMRMSEIAFDQPAEQLLRERGAEIAGVSTRDLYALKPNKTRNSEIKPLLEKQGINQDAFKELMIQAYRDAANGTP